MNEHIGKRKIGHGILIDSEIEIIVISAEVLAEAVVPIEHTGDSIEAETVQMVLLHPELAVGEEEMLGLALSVVETAAVPSRMMALIALIEVEVLASVEIAQALGLVLHHMRVDKVHNDRNSARVGIIHQVLELLRGAKTRTQGEEI